MRRRLFDPIEDLTARIMVLENKPVLTRADHDLINRLRAERLALRKARIAAAPPIAAE